MENQGFNFEGMHGVGHSLGGQLIGHIGREVIEISNQKLIMSRITALDPAAPLFYPRNNVFTPINSQDAMFVDVIHTGKFFIVH